MSFLDDLTSSLVVVPCDTDLVICNKINFNSEYYDTYSVH